MQKPFDTFIALIFHLRILFSDLLYSLGMGGPELPAAVRVWVPHIYAVWNDVLSLLLFSFPNNS